MNFDEIIDRKPTNSVKWSIYGVDVLPLWVADMDFRCPQPVMDALKARVEHGIFGYDLPPRELTSVVVKRMKQLRSRMRHRVQPGFTSMLQAG
jgi:cystathionine beta-lyase